MGKYKDLIIGAASGYDWNKLKYWVNSIKQSGFSGDIVLVASDISKSTIDRLKHEGVKLCFYGKENTDGSYVSDSKMAPHVERFFLIYEALYQLYKTEKYRFVIVTDTRDVIFQKNPSLFLDDYEYRDTRGLLISSSEGIHYEDEPWGRMNFFETFGPFIYERFKDRLICNVGVIAGTPKEIMSLMLMIFQLSLNRPISIVDQAVYNFILYNIDSLYCYMRTDNKYGWAIQLGTTREAVRAKKGDLGNILSEEEYLKLYDDWQPYIDEGRVYVDDQEEKEFVIVHQWDRIPSYAEYVERKYG